MFYLTGNSENVVYTSVSAVKELSSPTYLMSLTHSQTGRKWSFIPQNITPQSGTPFNQRYDLFKFDLVDQSTPEDLTGGTKAWYFQQMPFHLYQDSRYSGTSQGYLVIRPIVDYVFGYYNYYFDFDNTTEQITGATVTLDGISLPATILPFASPHGNGWFIQNVINTNLDKDGLLQIHFETNLGNVVDESYYVCSLNTVSDFQPWQYYGFPTLSNPNTTFPITYLDTPKIRVDEIGEFRYSIYEQANPINLNTSLAFNQLEVGLAYITEGFTDIYYESSDPSDVYNP